MPACSFNLYLLISGRVLLYLLILSISARALLYILFLGVPSYRIYTSNFITDILTITLNIKYCKAGKFALSDENEYTTQFNSPT